MPKDLLTPPAPQLEESTPSAYRFGQSFQRSIDPEGAKRQEDLENDTVESPISRRAQEGTLKMLKSMALTAGVKNLNPEVENLVRGQSKTQLSQIPWSDMLRLAAAGQTNEANRVSEEKIAGLRAQSEKAQRMQTTQEKAQALSEKNVNDTVDVITGSKRSSQQAPYQMAAKRFALANDGLRIIGQVRNGEITGNPQVETELATNLANQLTGGNQPAQQTIEHFMAQTGVKTIGQAIQYIKSKPQDTLTKDFLKQYENQLIGQRDNWRGVATRYVDAMKTKHRKDFKNDPSLEARIDDARELIFDTPYTNTQASQLQSPKMQPLTPQEQQRLQELRAKAGR